MAHSVVVRHLVINTMRMFDTRIRGGKYCRPKDQKDDDEKMIGFIGVYLCDFTDWVPEYSYKTTLGKSNVFLFRLLQL